MKNLHLLSLGLLINWCIIAHNPQQEIVRNTIEWAIGKQYEQECNGKNTLHDHMEEIFYACEALVRTHYTAPITQNPLVSYFNEPHANGTFTLTLRSGPNIDDFTTIMLGKHTIDIHVEDIVATPSLKIFNNVETFFRCLDICTRHYEHVTDKTIACDVSFAFTHIPLESFCTQYIAKYPELTQMSTAEREKFIRLVTVFTKDDQVLDLSLTLVLSLQDKNPHAHAQSFKPIGFNSINDNHATSNELSAGQQNLYQQIQNLNGSDLAMTYIKDADGHAQYAALHSVLGREKLNIVEIGGGKGETNAVFKAVQDAGSMVHLLNVEPHEPFTQIYMHAHHAIGTAQVHVIQKTAQELTTADVLQHYKGEKADVVFASHSFYFLLTDLYKAWHTTSMPLDEHPLWKYFQILKDDGVFIITLQTGAGARLMRNALLGNHGLEITTNTTTDEVSSLLSSFGNMATLLRCFDDFAQRYQQITGKTIMIKMHHSVANVPLGNFSIDKNMHTFGFELRNPEGDVTASDWISPKMLDFYGNWKELQLLAHMTADQCEGMPLQELSHKSAVAVTTQATFLRILPVFAPGLVAMQHPNITLEITVQ